MIPVTVKRDIQKVGNINEQSMALAAGSEAHIFGVLRKGVYAKPKTAILREYMTNAIDEHKRIGVEDKPFIVTFPTVFSPELKIRDFGRGLDDEQFFYFFGQYGASDKRETNELIGTLGLGNKCGLAYTDSFTVRCFKDGNLSTFNVYIDESEVGRVAKLGENKTNEPNGLEIIIPIKQQDISQFINEGIEVIRYFTVKPEIRGLAHIPDLTPKPVIIEGQGWKYYGSGKAVCLMGQIAYPIDENAMGGLNQWERSLLRSNLHLLVNIGEVQMTAAREALQMSPRTIGTIRKYLLRIKDEMLQETAKEFKNCKTLFDAKALYYETVMNASGYGTILREAMAVVEWNGHKISNNVISFDKTPHKIMRYTKHAWRQRNDLTLETDTRILCTKDLVLYHDDTDGKIVGYKRRARTLTDAGAKVVNILQTTDPQGFATLTGIPVGNLKSYNAVVPTFVSQAGGGSGPDVAKRAKHQTKVFQLDLDKLSKLFENANSDYWTIKNVDVENDAGLYIPIDRFSPNLPNIKSLSSLNSIIDNLKQLGVKITLPIYGLKTGVASGNLTKFDDWLKKEVEKIPNIFQDFALAKAIQTGSYSLYKATFDEKQLPNGIAKQYRSLYKKAKTLYNDNNNGARNALIFHTGKDIKADESLEKLSKQFLNKYPMMEFVPEHRQHIKTVIEYLKEKDEK